MGKSIFFKHLFLSVKKRPIQPLLCVLIITIAIAVSALAFELMPFLIGEIEGESVAKNGSSNIMVSVGSASGGRFIDVGDVQKTLGENTIACGSYSLPFTYGEDGEFLSGVAVSLSEAEKLFKTEYVSSKELNTYSQLALKKAVYVTQAFAVSHSLAVGDEISLCSLGYENSYKIYGISKTLLLGTYDVMMDSSGAVEMLPSNTKSKVILLGFKPAGKIYIKTDWDVERAIDALESVYPDADIVESKPDTAIAEETIKSNTGVIILLAIAMSIFTIYSCFSILATERRSENDLFFAVGARAYMLDAMSLVEMAIYWMVGMALGVLVSFPIVKVFGKIVGFVYTKPTVQVSALLYSGAIAFVATEFSTMGFILFGRWQRLRSKMAKKSVDEKKKKLLGYVAYILPAVTLVSLVLTIIIDGASKTPFAFGTLFGLLLTLFIFSKRLFVVISKRLGGNVKLPVELRYAVKNAGTLKSLHNVTGLISVFLVVFTMMGVVYNFAVKSNEIYKRAIDCDYLVSNAPATAVAKLSDVEGVANVCRVFSDDGYYSGGVCSFVASDDVTAFNQKFQVTALPDGMQVVMGKSFMDQYKYQIGDTFVLSYGGKDYPLEIIGSAKLNGVMVIVDIKGMGGTYNFLAVSGEEGVDLDVLDSRINKALEADSAIVMPTSKLMETAVKDNQNSIRVIGIITIAMALFAIIGLGDSIASGYRSRREEFDCYSGAGMNKTSLKKMKALEICYCFALGMIFYIAIFGLIFLCLYEGFLGFSLNIFYI